MINNIKILIKYDYFLNDESLIFIRLIFNILHI